MLGGAHSCGSRSTEHIAVAVGAHSTQLLQSERRAHGCGSRSTEHIVGAQSTLLWP